MTDPLHIDGISKLYNVLNIIGHGSSAIVRKARGLHSNDMYAIKIIRKRMQAKFLEREVEILKQVNHPNVIKYDNIIDGKHHLYIVLEYVDGGDLFDRIAQNPLSEESARNIFTQILLAVEYLHDAGIAHRDMKPENILLDKNDTVKLTDFGLARFSMENGKMITVCGTPHYLGKS